MKMSLENVEKIIGKAVTDSKFAQMLFEDPIKAAEGYDLSPEELESLKSMNKEMVAKFAFSLDKRIVKDDSWWVDSIRG